MNEVRLRGRVSAPAEERNLPSGDVVAVFRLVVPREGQRAGAGSRAGSVAAAAVDTIDVACWSGRARQAARRLKAGDRAEVSGWLRRRFYRTGTATASRYEVEARTVGRVRRVGTGG